MKFTCELRNEIPLPPEYTFPQALNYFSSEKNSFYILEDPEYGYVQCGGDKKSCTLELRIYGKDGKDKHYRLGKGEQNKQPSLIQMSEAKITVRCDEVMNLDDVLVVFKQFFKDKTIPPKYRLNLVKKNYKSA